MFTCWPMFVGSRIKFFYFTVLKPSGLLYCIEPCHDFYIKVARLGSQRPPGLIPGSPSFAFVWSARLSHPNIKNNPIDGMEVYTLPTGREDSLDISHDHIITQ